MGELVSLAAVRRARGLPTPRPELVAAPQIRGGDLVRLPDGRIGYVLIVDPVDPRDTNAVRFLVGTGGAARFYLRPESAADG